MSYDLKTMPFSRFGSYMAVTCRQEGDEAAIYMKTVHGGDEDPGLLFRLEGLTAGQPSAFRASFTAGQLTIETDGGRVELIFPHPDVLRLRGHGTGLRLACMKKTYDYIIPCSGGYELNSYAVEHRYRISAEEGELAIEAPWDRSRCQSIAIGILPDPASRCFDMQIQEYDVVPESKPHETYEEALARIQREFGEFLDRTLAVPAPFAEGKDKAAYITWSCVVNPNGVLSRRAMYMSKNWMTNIWSWDHCFNAMALACSDPVLSWDQFMIFFDRQHPSGMLPDFMNDKYASWNGCKPPIHGWTLDWIMKRGGWVERRHLEEIYTPLARWTEFWFRYRDDDGDRIPQYNHGNDSGWDNSTVFHLGVPVESPDLCAFLILQMEALGRIAALIDKAHEAVTWESQARSLLQSMISAFWRGDRFTARLSGSHTPAAGDSLQLYLPLVLGNRLPPEILSQLVKGLESRFLTSNGLATESMASGLYEPDGYWRGPVWAPSTMLIYEGLKACGENELARLLAERFCAMAAKAGMSENFDAITGAGLRDPAFTWTSSVFLILANELLDHEEELFHD